MMIIKTVAESKLNQETDSKGVSYKLVTVLGLLIALSPGLKATEFSMLEGFKRYFADNPPKTSLPTSAEKELLKKYRPRFYKGSGQNSFIDFYGDYIANGILSVNGKFISAEVTPVLLNQYRDNPEARFSHKYASENPVPVVYGRIDYDAIHYQGSTQEYVFLTYNLVFAASGLPAGLAGWQRFGLNLIADVEDWHQLDHYVASTIVLGEQEVAVAVVLQQHNYQTTYIIGKDVVLANDNRIKLDIAMSSNELYPHNPATMTHRAVSFLTPQTAEYLIFGNNEPFLGSNDITEGKVEVDYQLKFLPPNDAFYQFKGSLGESRVLPGRSGPPGADYNTRPQLKSRALAMVYNYRRQEDQEYIDLLKLWENPKQAPIPAELAARMTERFLEDLQPLVAHCESSPISRC